MTPLKNERLDLRNLGSLRFHPSLIGFADLRQEGSTSIRCMRKLFWQEDAFDSTRDQKKYFSKTHGSSAYDPEKDRLSPVPYCKDKQKDQLLRIM